MSKNKILHSEIRLAAIQQWISIYKSEGEGAFHVTVNKQYSKELKTSRTGGIFIMTKGRKTVFDERVKLFDTALHMTVITLKRQLNSVFPISRHEAIS